MIGPVSSCAIAMPGKDGQLPLVWLSLGLGAADLSVRMVLADAQALHLQLGVAIGTFAQAAAMSADAERAGDGQQLGTTAPSANLDALPRAYGRDPCPKCGVPGFKGCAHFAPCDQVALPKRHPALDPEHRT